MQVQPPVAPYGIDSPEFVSRLCRVVFTVAVVGWVYAATVYGSMLVSGDRPVPDPVWVVAFVGVLPTFGTGFLLSWRHLSRPTKRPSLLSLVRSLFTRRYLASVTGVVSIAVLVLSAAAVVLMEVRMRTSPLQGLPRIDDGQYVLDNHGARTVVSREEYERANALGFEPFMAIAMWLYAVAGVMAGSLGKQLAPRRQPAR